MFTILITHTDVDYITNQFDCELTRTWPVPAQAFSQLEAIRSTHNVIPLNVIEGGRLVSLENVQNVLRDALVEVTFSIEYFQYHSDRLGYCLTHNY